MGGHDDNRRQPGARYRIDQADGTWWELGWDRPLGTFYAQHLHHPPGPLDTDPLLSWVGTWLGEIPTVDRLAELIGRPIPPALTDQLRADQDAFPSRPTAFTVALDRIIGTLEDPPARSKPAAAPAAPPPHRHDQARHQEPESIRLEVIATGYHRSPGGHVEQVTRPTIYPYLLLADTSASDGVDLHHASVATLHIQDPDRDAHDPTRRIDLVRISAIDDTGAHAGLDLWLRQQPFTGTWERVEHPPRHGDLQPGPHPTPESWSLGHEYEVLEATQDATLGADSQATAPGLDGDWTATDGPDHGLEL